MRAQLMAIAFLLGCGGGGVDISTDQNNVCDQVAEVACHNAYQCCSEGEIERFLNVTDPRTEDECRSDISRRCVRQIAALDYGIDQKHVRFDSKLMNDCLNSLVAPGDTCATLASALPWTEACMNSAWIGLVEDSGACLSSAECASKDSFCGSNQTCIARPTEGQPCGAGCASGFFCATATGTCRAKAAAGGACTSSLGCAEGLFCDTVAAACAPLRAPGETCTNSAACTSAQCNPGTCAGSTTTCFTSSACTGVCANSTTTCLTDSACSGGAGTCSLAPAIACSTLTPCAAANGTCVFPIKCNQPACVGNVCADKHLVVDYCQAALTNLPVP